MKKKNMHEGNKREWYLFHYTYKIKFTELQFTILIFFVL